MGQGIQITIRKIILPTLNIPIKNYIQNPDTLMEVMDNEKIINFTLNDVKPQNPNPTEGEITGVFSENNNKKLKNINLDKDHIIIGSVCTFTEMKDNWVIPNYLKKAIQEMTSSSIRNLATIGENICNASPAGEILPLLYTVNAVVVLANREWKRKVPIDKFILSPGFSHISKVEKIKDIRMAFGVFLT